MSWLRLDDSFTSHPKFEGWAAPEKWALLELFSYCARYRTKGRVPTDRTLLPRSVTTRLLDRAIEAGWLDQRENGDLWVHDWATYNPPDPTNAERQRRFRERHGRNGAGVTDAVTDGVTDAVTSDVTPPVTSGVTESLPRARARAPVPVPSPREREKNSLSLGRNGDDEDARAAAWAARAEAPDVRSPTAFVRAGIAGGDWPDPPPSDPPRANAPVPDTPDRIAALIVNGVISDRVELNDEFDAADLDGPTRLALLDLFESTYGGADA
jgi:hypothetical protein